MNVNAARGGEVRSFFGGWVGDLFDNRRRSFFFVKGGVYAPDWTRRPGKGALKNWGLFAI